MSASVAATLAQIVPVLMLTLLFESKLRPDHARELSPLAVIFGFIGNLGLAALAIITEFSLLLSSNKGDTGSGAEPLWLMSGTLFVLVVLRWAATSLATRVVIKPMTETAFRGARGVLHETAVFVVEGLISPAQILANLVATIVDTAWVLLLEMSRVMRLLAVTLAQIFTQFRRR